MSRPIILLFEAIHKDGMALLRDRADLKLASGLDALSLMDQVVDADGIIVRGKGRVDGTLMEAGRRLRVVGRHGAGVDNIDLTAAAALGIVVVNTPAAPTESVAEHCLGLMLALSKRIVRADRAVRSGGWHARYEYIGDELWGKTLGLVGFGQIGQRLGRMCFNALDMFILYHDIREYAHEAAAVSARRMPLDALLAQADVVSLHVPLLPSTLGLIGASELRLMKAGAFLINTSRGPVVDEPALVAALQDGWIAGAGIDVFVEEPTPRDNPLFELQNVVVTPHMASHTHQGTRRMAMTVAEEVLAVLDGQAPRYPVKR